MGMWPVQFKDKYRQGKQGMTCSEQRSNLSACLPGRQKNHVHPVNPVKIIYNNGGISSQMAT